MPSIERLLAEMRRSPKGVRFPDLERVCRRYFGEPRQRGSSHQVSWIDTDRTAALSGIESLLQDVLDDMAESGETPPLPLADRVYSGRLQVRIPPEVHRRLATEAAEQGVSLNRLVSSRLAG